MPALPARPGDRPSSYRACRPVASVLQYQCRQSGRPGSGQAQLDAEAKVQHRHLYVERCDTGARLLPPAGFLLPDGDDDWVRRGSEVLGPTIAAG
jgi:hypothetical protein